MADVGHDDDMLNCDDDGGEAGVLRDACGVFGCLTDGTMEAEVDVKDLIYLGLHSLQHRGQESSGMVLHDGARMHVHKGMGLVSTAYADLPTTGFTGHLGIGHNRYSTAGASALLNCQPFVVHTIHGQIAVAHNGELVNSKKLRQRLLGQGIGLSTESDTELMTQFMVHEPPSGEPNGADWPARILNLMSIVECAYACVVLTSHGQIFGFRDVHGNRPLCLGEMTVPVAMETTPSDEAPEIGSSAKRARREKTIYLVASESCAFTAIGGKKVRDVRPGEIVQLTTEGFVTVGERTIEKAPSFCIFEYVYFARADTTFQGNMVYNAREACGRQLAVEAPVCADIVSTIPDSATPSTMAFATHLGIPYVDVVVKNRYSGRTFIQPSPFLRKRGVMMKFGPLTENIRGKRVVLVDDSIVRGNTMPFIVQLLRSAGASEVHIRIASPPLRYPCFMGINIPTRDELIANKYSIDEMAKLFGANSLVYLSPEGLRSAIESGIDEAAPSTPTKNPASSTTTLNGSTTVINGGNTASPRVGHCMACLTGEYPVKLEW